MADDALGYRGLAQVLQKPNTGNLGALYQMKLRQEENQAALAERKRKEDQAYFEKSIDLGKDPQMELVLNSDIGKVTNQTRNAIIDEFTRASKENRPANKAHIEELKSNLDTHRNVVSGYYQNYKDTLQNIGQNKDIINTDEARRKLDQNKEDFMSIDEKGNPTYDEHVAAKIKDFFNDGKIYNGQAVFKGYVNGLEPLSVDLFNRSDNTSRQITVPSSLYVTENKNGVAVPKRDMNGNFIPVATPEAVNTFEKMGNVYKLTLENHMEAGGFKNKTEALSDMIRKWGGSKETISNNYPPNYGASGPNALQSSIKVVPKDEGQFTEFTGDYSKKIGSVGPTLPLQNVFPDKALTVSLKDAQGVTQRVDVISLFTDVDGEKKILANGYKNGKIVDNPIKIPLTEANLQALVPTDMKGQKRAEFTKALNEFTSLPSTPLMPDEVKVNKAIQSIKSSFLKDPKEVGMFDSPNLDDEQALDNVKGIFKDLGIDQVYEKVGDKMVRKPVSITTDAGAYGGFNNVLHINGQTFNMGSENDTKKLQKFLIENAPNKLTKEAEAIDLNADTRKK